MHIDPRNWNPKKKAHSNRFQKKQTFIDTLLPKNPISWGSPMNKILGVKRLSQKK